MRAALMGLVVTVLSFPSLGQSAAEKQAAIAAAFETALRENTVFLNCSATEPESHKVYIKTWDDMVARSIDHLVRGNADAAFVAKLRARAAYAAVMRLDAPLREIVALCEGDWPDRFVMDEYVKLDRRIAEILGR